jgi:multiple sugar transport system ATP-binding protein
MAALEIRNVHKDFGKVKVLKDINISIESGEFLILVGPSGCGKSTLMNAIAGLDAVTAGSINIGGEDVTHRSPKDRDIAMVFQSYALYPSMNVRENISFGLEMRKVPKDVREKEVLRVAKLLQIEHLLDRKPSQLSGGQRQRVAMGRALAREPKVYLFDEPLSNLDAKLRVEMRTEIKKLHQRLRTTIVYVTHDQIEAMTLANRIAVMRDGVVLQLGTPHEIYDDPVNMFVAGFMGSPAMNFIPAELAKTTQGYGVRVKNHADLPKTLPLPPTKSDLSAWVGKEITLGLRPERITHTVEHRTSDPMCVQMQCRVEVLEPTGADTLLQVLLNGRETSCRIDPRSEVPPGGVITLMFDMSKAVVFNPQTQERL